MYTCQQIIYGTPLYQQMVALRYQVLRAPLRLQYTAAQLATEATDIHLAALDAHQNVVATIVLTPHPTLPHTLKMRQVCTLPALQGKGVGSLLVQFCEAMARAQSCTTIQLNARQTAVNFYEKNGYACIGDPFTEIGLPHIKMQKTL
jgi:predicted GNAT family N-acyltransferase